MNESTGLSSVSLRDARNSLVFPCTAGPVRLGRTGLLAMILSLGLKRTYVNDENPAGEDNEVPLYAKLGVIACQLS